MVAFLTRNRRNRNMPMCGEKRERMGKKKIGEPEALRLVNKISGYLFFSYVLFVIVFFFVGGHNAWRFATPFFFFVVISWILLHTVGPQVIMYIKRDTLVDEEILKGKKYALYNQKTNAMICEISASDLRTMQDCFLKTEEAKNDFYIMPEIADDVMTLEIAETVKGAIRKEMGPEGDLLIRWGALDQTTTEHVVPIGSQPVKKMSWTEAIMHDDTYARDFRSGLLAILAVLDIMDALANVFSGQCYALFGTATRLEITNQLFSLLQLSEFFNWRANTVFVSVALLTSATWIFLSRKAEKEGKYLVVGFCIFIADTIWLFVKAQVGAIIHLLILFVTLSNFFFFVLRIRKGKTSTNRLSADAEDLDNDSFKEF